MNWKSNFYIGVFPYLFLGALYFYSFHTDDIPIIHHPAVAIPIYVVSVVICGFIIANVVKDLGKRKESNEEEAK